MQGGLGNQLFSYFAGADLAREESREIILDISDLGFAKSPRNFELEKFKLPQPYNLKRKKRFKNLYRVNNLLEKSSTINRFRKIYKSSVVGYDPLLDGINSVRTLKGYFQTWKYVQNFEQTYNLFVESTWTNDMKNLAEAEEPIILHIRRGDYINLDGSFGLLSETFFKNAIILARQENSGSSIWIFTDSPNLISKEFVSEINGRIIFEPRGVSPAEIMSVMSLGKAIIISNSTFSWWSAYMNQNRCIIAPSKWFRGLEDPLDLYPPSWKIVESVWQ